MTMRLDHTLRQILIHIFSWRLSRLHPANMDNGPQRGLMGCATASRQHAVRMATGSWMSSRFLLAKFDTTGYWMLVARRQHIRLSWTCCCRLMRAAVASLSTRQTCKSPSSRPKHASLTVQRPRIVCNKNLALVQHQKDTVSNGRRS